MFNGKAEFMFHALFFVLYFGVPGIIAWLSHSSRPFAQSVNMSELWTHNGRADKLAVILLGSWWVHTCSIILWTLTKTISTTDFLTYMGWALPIIAQMVTRDRPSTPNDKTA